MSSIRGCRDEVFTSLGPVPEDLWKLAVLSRPLGAARDPLPSLCRRSPRTGTSSLTWAMGSSCGFGGRDARRLASGWYPAVARPGRHAAQLRRAARGGVTAGIFWRERRPTGSCRCYGTSWCERGIGPESEKTGLRVFGEWHDPSAIRAGPRPGRTNMRREQRTANSQTSTDGHLTGHVVTVDPPMLLIGTSWANARREFEQPTSATRRIGLVQTQSGGRREI